MGQPRKEETMSDQISYDVRRGHAYVRSDDSGRIVATLVDMGGACAVMTEGDMSANEARQLGIALISWSAWRRGVTQTNDHYQRTAKAQP
jgi:hypothetical protein